MSAGATISRWRRDPVAFVRENFEVEPDAWQVEAMMAAVTEPRVAMKACAGPGKTALMAWLGWWFLVCFGGKGEHPKGIALSCTQDNLYQNLWPELSKWQNRSGLLRENFTWTKERVFANCHPATWFLLARSFPKTANPEEQGRALSGLHSEYVMVLIDESGDIHPSVARAAEQAMGNTKVGRIITAGNTTSTNGMLYMCATHGRGNWHVITITGDPDDPRRSPRVDIDWAREQIALWGRDNPWVQAYILGEFPAGGINQLLSLQEVEAAMGKHLRKPDYDWAQRRLGVDVARFGDDRTVIFGRQGLQAYNPITLRNMRTTDIAARVQDTLYRFQSEVILIDDTGHWGHGVIDNLIAAGHNPIGIQFHGPACNPRYKNRRAEMWCEMADWIKRGGAIPPVPELVGELTAPTYSMVQGKLMLEDKDQIKKRLGKSPDLADSLALTFAIPEQMAKTYKSPWDMKPNMSVHYDPEAE